MISNNRDTPTQYSSISRVKEMAGAYVSNSMKATIATNILAGLLCFSLLALGVITLGSAGW
jgi:putative effector of murein hydrolase LrgA (UPF0299 family)